MWKYNTKAERPSESAPYNFYQKKGYLLSTNKTQKQEKKKSFFYKTFCGKICFAGNFILIGPYFRRRKTKKRKEYIIAIKFYNFI